MSMFDPAEKKKEKAMKNKKKKILSDIKNWGLSLIPAGDLHAGLLIDVNEVICGDPSCAPVDTVFTLIWEGGGRGVFAIPLAPNEISQDDLIDFFPDEDTLTQWKAGKKARWPRLPELRYKIGDRVECRIGPHPVKGWAPGRIIRLHYTEPNWPPNMVAPYQIALHDGRLIFAPQDTDQVIRLRPDPAPDAPSSPDYVPDGTEEGLEDGDEDDMEHEGDYEDEEEGGGEGDKVDEQDEEDEDNEPDYNDRGVVSSSSGGAK
mmetsp:Transcript_2208/g.2996  ORF Transcript_2208/g.2996 Transcript_2208/m.2996 type:complete len:261 (+) Transcript_2208:101-883(+)|eukprot:CAMPEP_0201114590 /NCGR_PEP_ID=MMETSP0812-20130820/78476_1 /ASSEMBLY_ACC=CAM_ASM_000668 /TAXON_ID=98059 /ORGANISM="Dinobryon sp., Strain UTEXLB2267" /LENGTH=260 /DNA_ID=CAMNT_0047378231 /DNA_START=87 /DNA_END=869 /DNA_ORIENTATION=+